jgi:1-aminocyclopropane-1-carboxylate deaminase/D-cysteine desulfhydrase-like pyridoxal-dependent ACC family enzyme
MHFIPLGGGGGLSLETAIRLARLVARLLVGRHYFIPVGGHSWLGCLGYVRAALEIHHQVRELKLDNAYLVAAVGTGGTLAGLMAGLNILDSPIRILGIDVGKLWTGFPDTIAKLTTEICARLGEERIFQATDVPLLEDVYSLPKYGIPSPEGMSAIRKLAQLEGILLDPVYTGKAFAGLLDLLEKGRLGKEEPIIFLHTGGLPALFAVEDGVYFDG